MTLSEKQRAFSLRLAQFIEWVYAQGYEIVGGEWKRPIEMQKLYVQQGKSKTMQSNHLDSIAVDLSLFKDGQYTDKPEDYRPLGEKWEEMGGRWGGRFGIDKADYATKIGWDSNHFEYNPQ